MINSGEKWSLYLHDTPFHPKARDSTFFQNVGELLLDYMQSKSRRQYCHVIEWPQTGFGLVTGFTELLQNITTNDHSANAN
jgi:hypothetical protein